MFKLMRNLIFVGIMGVNLGGCLTGEETRQQWAASDDAKCRSFGAIPGTDQYFQCRMSADQMRVADEQQRRAAMGQMGTQLLIMSQPHPIQ